MLINRLVDHTYQYHGEHTAVWQSAAWLVCTYQRRWRSCKGQCTSAAHLKDALVRQLAHVAARAAAHQVPQVHLRAAHALSFTLPPIDRCQPGCADAPQEHSRRTAGGLQQYSMGRAGFTRRIALTCAASMPEMSMVGMPAAASRSESCATSDLSRMPRPHRMCASAAAEYLRPRTQSEMSSSQLYKTHFSDPSVYSALPNPFARQDIRTVLVLQTT